jgi:hypothetical protein
VRPNSQRSDVVSRLSLHEPQRPTRPLDRTEGDRTTERHDARIVWGAFAIGREGTLPRCGSQLRFEPRFA